MGLEEDRDDKEEVTVVLNEGDPDLTAEDLAKKAKEDLAKKTVPEEETPPEDGKMKFKKPKKRDHKDQNKNEKVPRKKSKKKQ